MKVVVCVKSVPDTETKVQVQGTNINENGVNFVMSPYDEIAMELALQLKDKDANTEVLVMSLGGAHCEKTLRTTLAMGADKALHLKCDAYKGLGSSNKIAAIIAEHLQKENPNLILFGRQAIDSDQAAIGAMVAQKLSMGFLGFATGAELSGESMNITRDVEGGTEEFTAPLPLCLSTNKGLNNPRYASLKGVMAAKKKPLEVVEVSLDGAQDKVTSLEMPPARSEGKIVGEGKEAVDALITALKNEAKVI